MKFTFPGTMYTADPVTVTWYDGDRTPPESIVKLIGDQKLSGQGSIYVGVEGVLYSPYIAPPMLLPAAKFPGSKLPVVGGDNHYHQFVDAVLGTATTTAPFAYAGPLTEMVLLGCLATRFPDRPLKWDPKALKVTNVPEANQFVKRDYRDGWKEEGLA